MKRAYIVCGLGFGDEGKGTITEFLCHHHSADLVVRFSGGPQCSHNVVRSDNVFHAFSQFGAGTFLGVPTFLSRHMLIEPRAILREAGELQSKGVNDPLRLITIDPDCVILTPYHWIANQARERLRGNNRHGSVGWGVGEARDDELNRGLALRPRMDLKTIHLVLESIRARVVAEFPDVDFPLVDNVAQNLHADLERLRDRIRPWCDMVADTFVFEGSQGVLLDETHSPFPPYCTWTDCTFNNAISLLEETGNVSYIERVGVFRTYFTRHGHGPFPTESAELATQLPELHNKYHPHMGAFRIGHFDNGLAEYSIRVAKPDVLAFTHCDRLSIPNDMKIHKIRYISHGPTHQDKQILIC